MRGFTVIVLAAGRGTRMRSQLPKVLHEVCGRPMVLWPVGAALDAGAETVVVVDSPARATERFLPVGVQLAVQQQPDGTGGAARAAAPLISGDQPVVVLSGDVPLVDAGAIAELIAAHSAARAVATVASTVLPEPSGYGRVLRAADGSLERIVETKLHGDATQRELEIDEVNAGIYVFDGAALLSALPRLTSANAQGELYLPQTLDLLRADGAHVAVHRVEDRRLVLGVNDRAALADVRLLAREAILRRHMLAGVDVEDPASTSIDVDVRIEADATIECGTILRGTTRIGAGARVGPHTTAIDSQIGAGASVRVSWLEGAVVMDRASVGPFAYLRPGTRLERGAKAGTFVEVKNSTIGQDAKVPHLSYVGDADVGAGANLGASSITANYDGRAKQRTTIGEGVRGGVHVSYVAPVKVGDGASTAAGSAITEDVPDGALGVARARQRNVDGYAGRSGAGRTPAAEQ
ncbi:MAG: bifunctional UDP-N-acetylglucosamine diphosphorylase/glucosamine-1-phosphate N-acetyltransferase GlmU [Solirubrobacteraceae bacterium]